MPRKMLFTPNVMKHIEPWVHQGLSADQIARKIGCTPGTLRVRCSQAHISLRGDSSRRIAKDYPGTDRVQDDPSSTVAIHLTIAFSRRDLDQLIGELLGARGSRTLRQHERHHSRQRIAMPHSRRTRSEVNSVHVKGAGR
jgi:hypothetical protein